MSLTHEYVLGFTDAIKLVTTASQVVDDRARVAQSAGDSGQLCLMTEVGAHLLATAGAMVEELRLKVESK